MLRASLASLLTLMVTFAALEGCTAAHPDDDGTAPRSAASEVGEKPATLAGFHYVAGAKFHSDELFGNNQGWAVEVVQGGEDWQYAPVTTARDLGFRVIARIDQGGGMSIPARDDEVEGYANRHAAAFDRGATATLVGNEPNLEDECKDNRVSCDPARYAAVYAAVKRRVDGRTVLAAGPSPDRPNAKDWLASMQRALGRCPDGFALHAYAGIDTSWPTDAWVGNAVGIYKHQLDTQLALIDAAGCRNTPVYVTEFATQPLTDLEPKVGAEGSIQKMADIASAVLKLEQSRARTKAVVWFVGENRGGGWSGFAAFGQNAREEAKPALVSAFKVFGRANAKK